MNHEQAQSETGKRRHQGLQEGKKKARIELRKEQQAAGLTPQSRSTSSNRLSPYRSTDEEREARVQATTDHARILQTYWPSLLRKLKRISDPRNPKKIQHKLTLLMLYGILAFVFHYGSRRQTNGEMSHPMFKENLLRLFPELEAIPHADTLFRLLSRIDVDQIEQAQIDLVNQLIRKKKFLPYRINNSYPIAIDGTQKMAFSTLWCEQLQQRKIRSGATAEEEEPQRQYYVYVLEANLSFSNGMVIPLMSEFLDYQQGDTDQGKQDCETKAFHRLAERIKQAFPKLPVMLLLDGLYPTGPVMARCHQYHWQFMIVLKSDSLSTVWDEYEGLLDLESDNEKQQNWGDRQQHFRWVNNIRYEYGTNGRNHLTLHVVVCDEQWQTVDEEGNRAPGTSHHAWISSRPLNQNNVHERCNLAARHRWGIESCILVEKHQGYAYEHTFAKDWNAMRGYHYLMRIGHLINTLARYASVLAPLFKEKGVQGFIRFVRSTYSGPWFENIADIELRLSKPLRLSFI